MSFIDYYKIMGIAKDTPQNEIKAAYRKRAKQFHPDLHPDDPKAKAKFQALNEAYSVLSDPEKRSKYDRYGEHWKNIGMGPDSGTHAYGEGGTGFEGFDFSQFSGSGFSDFFNQIFGNAGGRNARSYSFGFNPFGGAAEPHYADSECAVNIDMYTALLGGAVYVQTQEGERLKLQIHPCTQPGTKVRLKNKGALQPNGMRGNLIITFNVQFPANLSNRQKELLEEMRRG